MRGTITGRDVFLHAFTIARLWGLPIYLRCLRATLSRRPTTFLAVVCACRAEAPGRGMSRHVAPREPLRRSGVWKHGWRGSVEVA